MIIGVLHPGEMGQAIGAALRSSGQTVLWVSNGRSPETAARAQTAELEDAATIDELARRADVIFSVCPPHAALETARSLPRFDGVYVDVNAISPSTARAISDAVVRYVDGGIIGPPPRKTGTTRLYLSGAEANHVAALFSKTVIEAIVISDGDVSASALKMAYAAWSKGTAALLLSIGALARAEGVEEALLAEWHRSQPDLPERSSVAAHNALTKGWRWIAEMMEVAETFAADDLPEGFHRAAAEIYRRIPHHPEATDDIEVALSALWPAP